MKTKLSLIRVLLATVTISAIASIVYAGPGPEFWRQTKPITTFSEAKAVGPDDMVAMQCKTCKTVLILDSKHVGPAGKGHEEWFAVGSKHTCDECKGEITVVKGKTTDAMQHNCSKCGEGNVVCSVAMGSKK
ncbi:MAG TPA: hypothetical protein VHO24_04525 [Opitutaceae bacterium]|nr:hypothetical protein [Opitutaceae bacterium]